MMKITIIAILFYLFDRRRKIKKVEQKYYYTIGKKRHSLSLLDFIGSMAKPKYLTHDKNYAHDLGIE